MLFVYNDAVEYTRFLDNQLLREIDFTAHSRLEFLTNATRYFSSPHSFSDAMLEQRQDEVRLK